MNNLKILFQQVFMISTGILFIIGIHGTIEHFTGGTFRFPWYYPFSFILTGFLSAVPTYLFILKEWGKQRRFPVNLLLHCLSIWGIVAGIGWVCGWYVTWKEFLLLSIEYIAVYIFVWVVSLWALMVEDKKINQALADIQDKE